MIGYRSAIAVCLVASCLALLGLGCNGSESSAPNEISSTSEGPALLRVDELAPATVPAKKCIVSLSGSPFEVDLTAEKKDTDFTIVLTKDGAEFDREGYIDSFNGFRLKEAAGEVYEPPIDLLRFPMHVGDKWDWKGQIRLSQDAKSAEARIETSEDTQYVGDVTVKAVKVTVSLKFSSSAQSQAERVLTFWFAPGRGLFKRQYDSVSVREPAP